ncbi:hypothetical protein BC830DRAFT_523879 [Chytriomyces sp. MP71]|nr:hypothetical protein BC830DRAFT_523879 [Chytriomyces sp. MP71]
MGSMLDHGSQPPTADPCASVIARRTESGIRSGSGEVEEDGFVVVKRDAYAKGDSDQTKDETVRVIAAEIVDNLVDKAVAQAVAVAETRELDLNVRGGLAVSAEGTSSIDSNGTSNSNGARAEVRQLGANVGSAVAIHPINSTVSPLEHNPAIPTLSEYMQLDESEGIMNQQPSLSDESDAHINTTTSASISMTQQDTVSDAIKSTDIMNLIYRDLVVPDRPVATHTTSHPAHQITSSDSLSVIDENSSTPAAGGQGPSSLDVSPQSANASVTKQRKRTLIQDDSDDENQEQEIISAEGGGGTGGPNNGATKATTSPTFIRPPPTELAKLNEKFEHTSRLLTRVRPVTRNSSVAPATTVPPTPEQSTAQRPVPPNPPLTFLAPPLSSLALSAVTSQAPTTSPELVILSSASASPPLLTSSAPASLSSNILLPSVTAGSSSTPSPNEYPDRILQLTADDFRKLCQIITGLEDRNYRIADPALFQTFLLPELKALSNFVITRFKISPHNIPPPSNNSARAEWHQYAQALLFSSLHSYPVDYPLNVRNANSALASAIRSAAQDHVNRIQELGRVRMARYASNFEHLEACLSHFVHPNGIQSRRSRVRKHVKRQPFLSRHICCERLRDLAKTRALPSPTRNSGSSCSSLPRPPHPLPAPRAFTFRCGRHRCVAPRRARLLCLGPGREHGSPRCAARRI